MNDEVVIHPGGPDHTPAHAGTAPRRGPRFTNRRALILLAVLLGALFIGLLVYAALLLTARTTPGVVGGAATGGLDPVVTIEGPGRGANKAFDRPMGVAFGRDGRVYVADTGNDRVCVFDRGGSFLFEFGGKGVAKPLPGGTYSWKPGRLSFPVGIDVDEAGDVYVADFRNDQIQVFDAAGRYRRSFPSAYQPVGKGSSGQDGKGIAVTDVAASDGLVYATDSYQVFVFTTRGKYVRQFGKPGRGAADLDHPNGIAVGRDRVFVSDSNHTRVVAFDRKGETIWQAGRIPTGASDQGQRTFGLPRGLTVLDDGSLLVADAFDFALVRVDETGKPMRRYGMQGDRPAQFNFPNDVDADDGLLAVADKENNRVQLLRIADE